MKSETDFSLLVYVRTLTFPIWYTQTITHLDLIMNLMLLCSFYRAENWVSQTLTYLRSYSY